MTDIKTILTGKVDAAVADWLPADTLTLWSDESFSDGAFLQKHVLGIDSESGELTVLRTWVAAGQKSATLSVDLQVPYKTFAGDINEDTFPHAFSDENENIEQIFRSHLLGEHVEFVWKSITDSRNGSFIARSAKVGREEQVIAGTVSYDGSEPVVEIGYRGALSDFDPRNKAAAFKM